MLFCSVSYEHQQSAPNEQKVKLRKREGIFKKENEVVKRRVEGGKLKSLQMRFQKRLPAELLASR